MFAYINGTLEEIAETYCVLGVNGMGFNIFVSANTIKKLPAVGDVVKLYTYTCVREDAFVLYGFLTKNELNLFKMLITVNGIGPKGGQAILSSFEPDELRLAILSGDSKAIAKAPGIGAKTAQRIILDLKDKLSFEDTLIQKEIDQTAGVSLPVDSDQKKEAIEALVALGYGQAESIKAVNAIPDIEQLDSGAVLKAALKHLF